MRQSRIEPQSAMPSSHKKVIVRRFSGDLLPGYLPSSGFLAAGRVDLLALDGRRVEIPLPQIRSISFVRDFTLGDLGVGERLSRRAFGSRPRGDGLWLRLTFHQDGDELEGLAAADLTLLNDLLRDTGIFLIPPDIRGNTQRVFIPHSAIAELHLLGVISAPARRKPTSPAPTPTDQPQGSLFQTATPAQNSSKQ